MAYREDVVWRADTGAYHARSPVLMPPMLDAQAAPATEPSVGGVLPWLASREATNLLLLLIFLALLVLVARRN